MPAQLAVSDGTTTINLIAISTGIHLNEWSQAIAQYKSGGVFRDNPQSSGRRLVQKQFDNAIETFDLKVNNLDRNQLIYQMQELLRLLEKATDYWTTDWQDTVVYLIAQAECEDNPRYAEIMSYSIPQLNNPYSQPFLGSDGVSVFDNVTLAIERKHWKENIPGNGTAIERSGTQAYDGRTLGITATSGSEAVFVSSKHNVANLTDIYVDDGGVFGSNLLDASLPYTLFPAVPALNDALYLGIDTSVSDSGPFSNLVWDIGTAAGGSFDVLFEYWDGGAWSDLNVFTDFATTDPRPFLNTGIRITTWIVPDDWATTSVNSVTGYWVRARVLTGDTPPTQANRNVYSNILPYVNIDSAQIGGDIPALMKNILNQEGARTRLISADYPEIFTNRVIVGLRSTDRGSNFTAYLNCADEQEPNSVYSVSVDSESAFANDLDTATGRRVTFNPSGVLDFATRITFVMSSINHFYGTYHVFVRCKQVGGNTGDINIRLAILATGFNVTFRTDSKPVLLLQDDWHVVDLGIVNFPPKNVVENSDNFDSLSILIEANNTNASPPDLHFADVILVPVDEWVADVVQTNESAVLMTSGGVWPSQDIDSIDFPKVNTRAVYRESSGSVSILPSLLSNGQAILQANESQRLWYFLARYYVAKGEHTGANNASILTDSNADFINEGVEVGMIVYNTTDGSNAAITDVTATTITGTLSGGTDNDWDTNDDYRIVTKTWSSRPELAAAIDIERNQRYLSMRGDR